jgi:hypothetical protein
VMKRQSSSSREREASSPNPNPALTGWGESFRRGFSLPDNMDDMVKKQNKVLDLREVRRGQVEAVKEVTAEPLRQFSEEEKKAMWAKIREPEKNVVWPTLNPDAPLCDYEERKIFYLNMSGKQVVVDEPSAFRIHNRMKEFHGDQNGNMTPPRHFTKRMFKNGRVQYMN